MGRKKADRLLILLIVLMTMSAKKNPAEKYFKAVREYEKSRLEQAEVLFKEFMAEQPFEYEIRDALFYMGEISRKQEQYADAIGYYNRLESRYPHSRYRVTLFFVRGYSYYYLGLLNKSSTLLQTYLTNLRDPSEDPDSYILGAYLLGNIHNKHRSWKDSVEYYQKSILIIDQQTRKSGKYGKQYHEIKKEMLHAMGIIYAERLDNKELAHQYLVAAQGLGYEMSDSLRFLLRKMSLSHYTMENGLTDNSISDIKVDGDDVWIGT